MNERAASGELDQVEQHGDEVITDVAAEKQISLSCGVLHCRIVGRMIGTAQESGSLTVRGFPLGLK